MRTAPALALALATLALAACGRPSDTGVPSVAPEAVKAAPDIEPPPLPVRTDVNAAEAEADMRNVVATRGQPLKDGPDQALYVAAQEAAAKAPDTASGDEAKKRVREEATSGWSVPAGNPRAAELTKSEEIADMPKPGQANDHSSDGTAGAEGQHK